MLLVHAQYEKLLARHGFSENQSPSLADQVILQVLINPVCHFVHVSEPR
jgi:hypothetical protein